MCTHHPRPGGRTTAAAVVAVALICSPAPAASAASSVFGGRTSADEAIVVRADAKAKKLSSIAIAWESPCADGMDYWEALQLLPAPTSPTPEPDQLIVSRNAPGRFVGVQRATQVLGHETAIITTDISGHLRARRASGTLAASVTIVDTASRAPVTTCTTGALTWSATRDPGRVYGGQTSQEEPVVVRLDRRRRKVAQLFVGWESERCDPAQRFMRVGDEFVDFPLRSGKFGDAWDQSFDIDGGENAHLDYAVAGKVARRSARGTVHVRLNLTDAAGGVLACDTETIQWRATTG